MHVPEGFEKYYGDNFFKIKAYDIWFKAGSNGILEGIIDGIKIDEIQSKQS
jgi:hypothetical protein